MKTKITKGRALDTGFPQFNYINDELHIEDMALGALAKEHGSPLYIYSKTAIKTQVSELKKGLDGLDFLICFAVKSNSNLSVLRLMNELGLGVDIVSGGELYRARRAELDPEKIVFSGVGKTREEIEMALDGAAGMVKSLHVESLEEILEIEEISKTLGVKASISLRFNPDIDAKTHPYISTGLHKNKFGINREEIEQILPTIMKLSHIDLHGLSIHIGSQLLDLGPIEEAFVDLKDLAADINQSYPGTIKCLDLGGGLGIKYHDETPIPIADYTATIQKHFSQCNYQILLEPGRIIMGNSGILLTKLLYRKPRETKDFLVVDASMSDLIRPCLYGSYHHILPVNQNYLESNLKNSEIVGPVCESSDFFASDRMFSTEIKNGEFLSIMSTGAYGFSMSSHFNSRPKIAEILVDGSDSIIIREKESFEDLINGE
ncbi:MAG: diaminopimelate decarboxylase [Bacteriovoracaceae bacterium]|nr:diaminopimelate decarboxylase [Bacteriovoracaceae bacterium]